MNCEELSRRILLSEEPAKLAGDTAEHVRTCTACADLQHRLVSLEKQIRELPLPGHGLGEGLLAKARLLERVSEPRSRAAYSPRARRSRWQSLRRTAAAALVALFVLAAGLALGLNWSALPWKPSHPTEGKVDDVDGKKASAQGAGQPAAKNQCEPYPPRTDL